jgi:hypothetical protein
MSTDNIDKPKLVISIPKEVTEPEHVKKHKIWNEKQKNIFYVSGRPIYNTIIDKKHQYYTTTNGTVIGSYSI